MIDIIEKAKELRATVERLAQLLNDKDALENIELFPKWSGEAKNYEANYKVKYQNKLYRVLKAHISNIDNTPAEAAALYAEVQYSPEGNPLPWVQPTSANPYKTGDKVIYNNKIYKSLIDNNTWSPDDYPLAWEEITE